SNLLKIAVIGHSDFLPDQTQISQGVSIGLPDALADRIIEHLTNSKRFMPVERKALRKVVLEQRFGKNLQKTYLDRTLDKAIASMKEINGGVVVGAPTVSPQPVGGGITAGAGDAGVTGALAIYNDILKDFQDLGTAVGADYLVLGNVEKIERKTTETAVPYSDEGRTVRKNVSDARISLRIIEVKSGKVAGATSLRTKVSETLFAGKETDTDEYSFIDHLGRLSAVKILDVTFPARIASLEPLVISRGTNDGIKPGDIYMIQREGKEIKDDAGIVLGKLKTEIGKVEVVTPQETVAVVKPVSGGNFLKDDLACIDIQETETKSATRAPAEGVPLTGAQTPGKQIPRVAVGLIKSGSTARTGKDAAEHTPIFTDTIISRLTQTKRFQLIDRQEVDQLLNEQTAQALAEGRDLASAMGTLKGADYLVYGSLANFSVEDKTLQLPNSSRSFSQKIGYVEGNMRIVDARSGHVMESRKISIQERVEVSAEGSRIVTALANAYAEEVVLILMNAVYPIKVASAGTDGTVYVNRGSDGGLSAGETLDAFRPGKPVTDPDTGVQLGVEEIPLGKVVLNDVEDARSKGTFSGSSNIQMGDILKRTPANRGKRASASETPAPSRTGVVLPGGGEKIAEGGKSARATLAVGLIRLNQNARTDGFDQGHLKRITDDLIVKLSNTSRFQLMERQEVDQVLDEKAFAAVASGGNIQDRLRQLAGADYLIHGEIANLYTDTQRKNIAVLGEEQVRVSGIAEGTLRIVDAHSGAVVAADKIHINERIKSANDKTQVLSRLMDRFTTEAVNLILGRLYPIKLLGIAEDGTVYLNRGADAGLKNGVVFDVMRQGQDMVDQDTGLSFGKAETKVAAVEIVAVEASRARAKLLSGSEVKAGDILRKPQAEVKKPDEQQKKIMQPSW
ncbi:MAG: CsgG/HfaB family protein, partial [Pseudomonadota bacterium]